MDVIINWDEEAAVWYAVCDELGLALESGSYDALIEKIKTVSKEMQELNDIHDTIIIKTESRQLIA